MDNLGGGSANWGTISTQGRRLGIEITIDNSRTRTYGVHSSNRGRTFTNVGTISGTTK